MSDARGETYVETPFNMMIVGMTGCGKTYYLLEMIEKEYFRHFDYIFGIRLTKNGNIRIAKDSTQYHVIKTRWMTFSNTSWIISKVRTVLSS